MSKVIATIKLAPGKVAFYDEYSHIHLTIANPIAYIYEDTPLKRIKASIKSGTLRVINGNLGGKSDKKICVEPKVAVSKASEKKPETINEPITATKPIDEPVVAEPVITEAPVEEAVIQEAPVEPVAEKTTKKSRKKTVETTEEIASEEIATETAE